MRGFITWAALALTAAAMCACRSPRLLPAAQTTSAPVSEITGTYALDLPALIRGLREESGGSLAPAALSSVSGMKASVVLRPDGTYTFSSHTPFTVDGGRGPDRLREEGTWSRTGERLTFRPLRGVRNGEHYAARDRPKSTGVLVEAGFMRFYTDKDEPVGYSIPLRRR